MLKSLLKIHLHALTVRENIFIGYTLQLLFSLCQFYLLPFYGCVWSAIYEPLHSVMCLGYMIALNIVHLAQPKRGKGKKEVALCQAPFLPKINH